MHALKTQFALCFVNIYKSSKDNKLRQFSFKVMHRTPKKELLKYKSASVDKCPFYLNQDSIKHTFMYCQQSNELFSTTLRWFNNYHKNVQFNTFKDSFPLQMSNSNLSRLRLFVLLQKKYLHTCKSIFCT